MMNWALPSRFTVGISNGLTKEAILAISEAARREDVDPRAMAARLIIEGLRQRGLLDPAPETESERA